MQPFKFDSLLKTPIEITSSEKYAYFAVAELDEKTLFHVEIEPATAAALWEIAKGILANLGAKALARWFGQGAPADLQALFRSLILDIADIVRSTFDEARVEEATSDMQGLNLLMKEYSNSPETSRFRLEACVTQSAVVLKRLENLMPLSASAYIFGVLVRLAAAQEISLLTDAAGERQNVRDFASSALPTLRNALERLITVNASRVSDITFSVRVYVDRDVGLVIEKVDAPTGEREPPPTYMAEVAATYYIDGIIRRFVKTGYRSQADEMKHQLNDPAVAAREIDLERVRVDFMSRVGLTVTQSIQSIEEISRMP